MAGGRNCTPESGLLTKFRELAAHLAALFRTSRRATSYLLCEPSVGAIGSFFAVDAWGYESLRNATILHSLKRFCGNALPNRATPSHSSMANGLIRVCPDILYRCPRTGALVLFVLLLVALPLCIGGVAVAGVRARRGKSWRMLGAVTVLPL